MFQMKWQGGSQNHTRYRDNFYILGIIQITRLDALLNRIIRPVCHRRLEFKISYEMPPLFMEIPYDRVERQSCRTCMQQ